MHLGTFMLYLSTSIYVQALYTLQQDSISSGQPQIPVSYISISNIWSVSFLNGVLLRMEWGDSYNCRKTASIKSLQERGTICFSTYFVKYMIGPTVLMAQAHQCLRERIGTCTLIWSKIALPCAVVIHCREAPWAFTMKACSWCMGVNLTSK